VDAELRYAKPGEFAAVADLDGASFGFSYSQQDLEDALLDVDVNRILVAEDAGRIVGASAEVPFDMTLPDGQLAVTGLSWVSVEVTHRRRGILRSMMERQVRDRAERGDAALILTASEGGIYGRYGYGSASDMRKVVVDRRGCRLLRPLEDTGVARLGTEEVRDVLPGLYDRWRRRTPGALDRNKNRWTMQLLDRESQRHGMSGLFHLVHEDGYVSYRMKSDYRDGHPAHLCWITDYVVASPAAHAGLWQVLLGMDMTATIESFRVPIDDPLPYRLADPRRMRTIEVNDGLWVRPLHVDRLLAARSYAVDVDVVLAVRDPLLGDRTVRLVGGPDGASCEPVTADADVTMHVADLGALVLGGRRLAPMAAAGSVQARDGRLLARLDRALLADVAPQYGTAF
jgi:predicted acetyltransferase